MDTSLFCYDGSKRYNPQKLNTGATPGVKNKKEGVQKLIQNQQKIAALQEKLYAEGRQGLVVLFQAMDAGGKDGTIKHVFSGLNPQGVQVTSFKEPSEAELAHDYLWRIHAAVPPKGQIGVFNRSHYEDVLVTKVLNLPKTQGLPARVQKDIWKKRYRHIREFEQYLVDNGYTVLKFHLGISKEEQKERFLARLEDPAKNWKFAASDLKTRDLWDEYMKAYRDAINNTAAEHAPWYVIPADKKWYARLAVSQVVAEALERMKPSFPKVDDGQREELLTCRALLQPQPQGAPQQAEE